jgi:hypothetical protein
MAITDIRRAAQSQPAVGERAVASRRRRGRHRRPSTRRAAWLAVPPSRGSWMAAPWSTAAYRAAILGCVVLVLAGLLGVQRGDRGRRVGRA